MKLIDNQTLMTNVAGRYQPVKFLKAATATQEEVNQAVEITRDDFIDPAVYDQVYGDAKSIVCIAFVKRTTSKYGCAVGNGMLFPKQEELYAALKLDRATEGNLRASHALKVAACITVYMDGSVSMCPNGGGEELKGANQ